MEKLLEWKDEYCIGDAVIDEEHRNLFILANEIFQIRNPEEALDKIRPLLYKLYDYMKYHFDHEEAFMAQIKFQGIVFHKIRHSEIIDEMNAIMKSSHQISTLSEKLTEMMVKWVLKHILEEDFKMKSTLAS
ncbi:MAG: hemerythrin family protein [Deltaproteobacteria bacterium]|nr:hemerythrin family protein [Deltaproteobacteria bacterium]